MIERAAFRSVALLGLALACLLPREAAAPAPPFLTQWGTLGTGNGQFQGPMGLAVDDGGSVYVADMNNNRIQRFTSAGTYLTQWGTLGSGNGEFMAPISLAIDANGHVYVGENGNRRVQVFTSDGSYITQWGTFPLNPQGLAVDKSGNVYISDTVN